MENGFTFNPPQPTLRSNKTELCSFTKDDNTASGAVGVLTYELFHMRNRQCNELIAVMFSVPYDYNVYKNWLGLGIYEHTCDCDEKLFKLMYYEEEKNFIRKEADGSGLKYAGKTVDLRATMSNEGKALIKLELYDKMGK